VPISGRKQDDGRKEDDCDERIQHNLNHRSFLIMDHPINPLQVRFGRLRRYSHITRNVHQIVSELMATPVPFSHYAAR